MSSGDSNCVTHEQLNNMILQALSLHTQEVGRRYIYIYRPHAERYKNSLHALFNRIRLTRNLFLSQHTTDELVLKKRGNGNHSKPLSRSHNAMLWPSGCTPLTPLPDTFAVWRMQLPSDPNIRQTVITWIGSTFLNVITMNQDPMMNQYESW